MNATASPRMQPASAWGLAYWCLTGIAALWLVMSLTYPFGWDQGILAWAGGITLRGGLPFRDAWDMKGPVVYYVFALAQALFGQHLWSIRIVDAGFALAASVSIARAVGQLTSASAGRWSGLVFVLWYASHSYWHTAQPDGWVSMLLAVALLPMLTSDGGARRLALVGAAIGLMSLVKPLYAAFLLLPAIFAIDRDARAVASGVAAVAAGWMGPIAFAAAWFAWHGALDDLVTVHIQYSTTSQGQVAISERARGLIEYLFGAPVVAVGLPVMIAGAVSLWHAHRAVALVLAGWLVTAAALVMLQGRFFAYHWLPVLPAAVVLGAVGIHAGLQRARPFALAVLGVVVAQCITPIVLEELRFLSWLAGRTDRAAYYDAYGEPGDDMRAVDWLRRQGIPGKLYMFGWNTSVPWLSQRETVSRFGFSMPLLNGEDQPTRAAYRAELLAALRADPAAYIILGTQSQQILRKPATINEFPALAALVRTDYVKVAEFGALQIHERVGLRADR